jgi:hypothetical protein
MKVLLRKRNNNSSSPCCGACVRKPALAGPYGKLGRIPMRFACSARLVAGFLFAFAACSQVDAAQPSFGDVQPHGVQRGTESVIKLTG